MIVFQIVSHSYLFYFLPSSALVESTIRFPIVAYLSLSVDEIRPRYSWQGLDGKGNGGICQDSVPQAIICALEARDFEDAIRNAVSIGGDSDTIGCITGGIAEGLFGIPEAIREEGMTYLPKELRLIVEEFETKYGCR